MTEAVGKAASTNVDSTTAKKRLKSGKLVPSQAPAAQSTKQPSVHPVSSNFAQQACPECSSQLLWKDGLRYLADGTAVQRFLCRNCGFRFSESRLQSQIKFNISRQSLKGSNSGKSGAYTSIFDGNFPVQNPSYKSPFSTGKYVGSHDASFAEEDLNALCSYDRRRRVCVSEIEAKNLAEVESRNEKRAAGATKKLSDTEVKGKIVEFAWWLKKEGKSELTITNNISKLRKLAEFSDLLNPEKVKETLSNLNWKNSTKMIAASVYTKFLEFLGLSWKPPKYQTEETFPFIPLESEIDQLIASCGKRTATLLQLLKETGIRIGEAAKTRWIDFDVERQTISVRPLKGSNPRIFKISNKLAKMLNTLPKQGENIFNRNTGVLRRTFEIQRAKAAEKLKNPRLKNITFHTLRHWKGTMEYHKTKDPWHVKNVLGHKNLKSTQVYINIEHALFQTESDEFHVKIAETPEEIKALLEVGFEYVCEKSGLMFFRKRK